MRPRPRPSISAGTARRRPLYRRRIFIGPCAHRSRCDNRVPRIATRPMARPGGNGSEGRSQARPEPTPIRCSRNGAVSEDRRDVAYRAAPAGPAEGVDASVVHGGSSCFLASSARASTRLVEDRERIMVRCWARRPRRPDFIACRLQRAHRHSSSVLTTRKRTGKEGTPACARVPGLPPRRGCLQQPARSW